MSGGLSIHFRTETSFPKRAALLLRRVLVVVPSGSEIAKVMLE
jgi:hypothetical protein